MGEGKATSAEGASEGSQGQAALRAAPGSSEKLNRALKGRSKRQCSIPYGFDICNYSTLAKFFAPLQGGLRLLT